MPDMHVEDGLIVAHESAGAAYSVLTLQLPRIAPLAKPGQFVHVRLGMLSDAVLRRPFSIYRTEGDCLSVLYKAVGRGTAAMRLLQPGAVLSVMGPLGNGFPEPQPGAFPVLVAGGYGIAPLYFLASRLSTPGALFVGGARKDDILLTDAFRALGWDVAVATEDGSLGTRGLVTVPLDLWLGTRQDRVPEFFTCGPNGLLKAVGDRAIRGGWRSWLSLDRHMGCAVGACLACVQRVRKDGVVALVRVCKEGPVFEGRDVVWE